MNKKQTELLLKLATKCMNTHVCAGDENDYDAPIIEAMEHILILNDYARQADGDVSLEVVEELLAKNQGEAILLLVGDQRPGAKRILLNCILNPEYSRMFYLPRIWGAAFNFKGSKLQKIGPYLALISSDIEAFTDRYGDRETRFCGHHDWLRFVSGWPTTVVSANQTIVGPLTRLLRLAGAYNESNDMAFEKIARVMLLETYFNEDGCFEEVESDKLIGFAKSDNPPDNGRLEYHSTTGEIETFELSSMHDGNNKHILLHHAAKESLEELIRKFELKQ